MVERGRLVERTYPELAIEHANAVAVLLHCGLPVADLRQEPDQLPVRRLVQRVEGEPAPCAGDGLRRVAGDRERIGEPVEHRGDLALQLVAGELLPVVVGCAVAEAEAGQEGPAVESDRLLERLEAARAGRVGRMPVLAGRRNEAPSSSTSNQIPSPVSATLSRPVSSQRPPSADFSVESVRRRVARARSGSVSGQSSAASVSRRAGRPVNAR